MKGEFPADNAERKEEATFPNFGGKGQEKLILCSVVACATGGASGLAHTKNMCEEDVAECSQLN